MLTEYLTVPISSLAIGVEVIRRQDRRSEPQRGTVVWFSLNDQSSEARILVTNPPILSLRDRLKIGFKPELDGELVDPVTKEPRDPGEVIACIKWGDREQGLKFISIPKDQYDLVSQT